MPSRGFRIGSVFIGVEVDPKYKRDLNEARADTERFAHSAEREADKVSGAFSRMGGAATRVQEIVSRLLIPAAVAGSIAGLVSQFRQAAQEAKAFRQGIEDIGDTAQRVLQRQAAARAGLTELQATRLQLLEEERAAIASVERSLDAQLEKTDTLAGQLRGLITGLVSGEPTARLDAVEAAAREIEKIRRDSAQRIRLIEEEARERRRREREEEARAAEEAARKQAEELQKAIENAFTNAFASARTQQQGLFNDLRTSVENIAQLLEQLPGVPS